MKKKKLLVALFVLLVLPVSSLAIESNETITTTENLETKSSTSFVENSDELKMNKDSATMETTTESELRNEKEMKESSEEDSFEVPVITEETQHVLGNASSSKSPSIQSRSFSDRASDRILSDSKSIPRIDFVDVSSHQGEITVQDFLNMKKQGVTGVVVKLTEATTYENPYASSQINNAKAAGLKVSAYHYSWFQNKNSAIAEARFFAKIAKKHGLDNSNVLVNDAEQSEINNGKVTENSVYFTNTLKNEFGFKKVYHYSMASWFNSKILDMNKLGGDSYSWKAEFPYSPSKNNLLHSSSSAWQWASDVHFVGDRSSNRLFDANIDYSNTFSYGRSYESTPINKRSFINKETAHIYNEPYTAGTLKQDETSGMKNELIYITAKSETSYGLWYEFSYTKNNTSKQGWIKSG